MTILAPPLRTALLSFRLWAIPQKCLLFRSNPNYHTPSLPLLYIIVRLGLSARGCPEPTSCRLKPWGLGCSRLYNLCGFVLQLFGQQLPSLRMPKDMVPPPYLKVSEAPPKRRLY